MVIEKKGFSTEEKGKIRELFSHIKQGKIYLNHAAISPLSTPVKDALNQFILDRHENRIDDFESWLEMISETREQIAELLNVAEADSITFLGNTSDAISAVAEGFPWELRNFDQPWLPVSKHLETGTGNMLGIAGLHASLNTFRDFGYTQIQSEISSLTNYLYKQLELYENVSLLTNQNPKRRAGIISFSVQGMDDADSAVQLLNQTGNTISAREGFFRISPHYYNTEEEIDTVLEQLLSP